jgi:hypothetical protein
MRDLGTRESQAKRHAWINGADPQLAASASGILYANGQIEEDAYLACLRYSRCHAIVYRRLWFHTQNSMGIPLSWAGQEPTESMHEWAERQLDRWAEALTPEQKQAIGNVACFNFMPTWAYAHRLRWRLMPQDEVEREALISGLRVLAGIMGIAQHRPTIQTASWADVINSAAEVAQQKEADNE